MPGKKRTNYDRAKKDEYEDRLDEIIRLILDGEPNTSIVTIISKKFDVTGRQAYNYIQDANSRLAEINCKNIYTNYIRSISFKNELLKKAMQANDIGLALKISESVDKLTGVAQNALLITMNLDFTDLFIKTVISEFIKVNEIGDKYKRSELYLGSLQKLTKEVLDQVMPFIKMEGKDEDPEEDESKYPIGDREEDEYFSIF